MKALIVDDEERARLNLRLLIHEFCPEIVIVDECKNIPEAVKSILKHQPEIVFLDIEMPGHSGLELLDFFNEKDINFSIIFTTAYNNYAIRAFKLSAVDYLLKPINPLELQNSIGLIHKKNNQTKHLSTLRKNLEQQDAIIGVPVSGKIIFVNSKDILYLKAEGSYTNIIKTDHKNILVSRNLRSFEDNLEFDKNFFRLHKSFIVNISYISAIIKSNGGSVELINGEEIPASPEKINEILEVVRLLKR